MQSKYCSTQTIAFKKKTLEENIETIFFKFQKIYNSEHCKMSVK